LKLLDVGILEHFEGGQIAGTQQLADFLVEGREFGLYD
jgi:hypothetical protein